MRVGGTTGPGEAGGADITVSRPHVVAISAGVLLSGVGAGLWFGVGAGLLVTGVLLVFVPLSSSILFMRMTLDAFGPHAEPPPGR